MNFFLRTIIKNKIVINTTDSNYIIMQEGGVSTRSVKNNFISSNEILKSFKENKLYSNYFFVSLRFPIKLIQFLLK